MGRSKLDRIARSLRRFLHPPIDRADPEERFRLRVIRTQAQVTSAAFFIPLIVYALGLVNSSGARYLLMVAAASGTMTLVFLWLLRKGAHRASQFLVPVAFLLPDVVLPFGLTVELVYPVLIIMVYALLLLPTAANVVLHGIHLSIIAGFIAFTDTYSLFPPEGDINGTHYFSTYLVLHAIGVAYTVNFRIHMEAVNRELREQSRELAYLNEHLEDELLRRTEQLERQQDELSRRRRAEVVANIASGIAHDISNLLGILRVNVDVLDMYAGHRTGPIPEEERQARRRIHGALERGRQLVERIYATVRHEPLAKERFTVRDLFDGVIDLARSTQPANVRLVQEHQAPDTALLGDRAQLEQVFLNLVRNAFAAIGDEPGEVRLSSRVRGKEVRVEVVDTGAGIAPTHLPHIFDPFYTTKPQGQGTGLGLAHARRIVEEHDGTIEVESQVDVGTTFTVTLPRASDPQAPASDPGPQPVGAAKVVTILAEDEDDIAEVVAGSLPATHVVRARTVREALRALRSQAHAVELLVLDLTLPGGSGREVFYEARRLVPDLPVLITTGQLEGGGLQALLAEPNTAYLAKPFSLRDLRAAVARMMGMRRSAERAGGIRPVG